MDTQISILIAKIASVVLLSAGVGLVLNKGYYKRMEEKFMQEAGVDYLAGIFTITIGCLILNYNNVWEASWAVVITLLGWIVLIKGISTLAFPKAMKVLTKAVTKTKMLKYYPAISIIFGLLLGYIGFFLQ